MKILHIVETLDPAGGGMPAAVKSLVAEQVHQGHSVSVVSCRSKKLASGPSIKVPTNNFRFADFVHQSPFNLSATWRRVFNALKPDFCHLHGIWTPKFVFASKVLFELGISNIVSPHGQLMPSLLKADNSLKKLKKFIYWRLLARGVIERANIIHVASQAEADVLAQVKNKEKIRKISNFVDADFFNCDLDFSYKTPVSGEIKIITFMGRVERRKGIANLVEAFCASTLTDKWQLRIIGPVYEKKLGRVYKKQSQKRRGQ
jgi:glycosyltransferase involved in cell wall biosynthesis